MNAKSKAFAFISVALMISGAFVFCPLFNDDSNADGTYNATAGQWFDITYDSSTTTPDSYIQSANVYQNVAGLNYTVNQNGTVRVYGTPTASGTYKLHLYCFSEADQDWFDDNVIVNVAAPASHTVSFNSMGGTSVAPQNVTHGGCATTPANPTNGVNVFGGWFTDQACTQAFNFSTPIYNDIILYAKWTTPNASVTSSHGNSTMVVGQLFSYNVSTNPSNATVSVSGADWLNVSGHSIYGTPTTPGTYNVTITSSASGYNSGSQSFTITVSSVLAPGNTPSNGVIAYVR